MVVMVSLRLPPRLVREDERGELPTATEATGSDLTSPKGVNRVTHLIYPTDFLNFDVEIYVCMCE